MHTYFRAIGFSEPMKNLDRLNLMDDIMHKASQRSYTNIRHIESSTPETESMRTEFSLDLGEGYGITLVGEYDEDEEFIYEDMFPYMFNGHISTMEEITVEPRMDGYSYLGICDDLKLGVTLIFRLRNTVDFLKNGGMTGEQQPGTSAALSALSVEGTVMLPIRKTEKEMQMVRSQAVRRKKLMTAARTGDENAMKDLTLGDMDTYSVILGRIQQQEDIYSLVDSTFMPTGVECDLYNVLGEIVHCRLTRNPYTLEEVYVMVIDCNDLKFTLCINKKDLYGEPAPGRRFKGIVWMQGEIHFG